MKNVCRLLAVAVLFVSTVALAGSFDGTYNFKSRAKDGQPDMQGWTGTMTIKNDEITRNFKSPDGTQEKYYTSTWKKDGDVYAMKFTKAYKPEYVGKEYKNKVNVTDNTLTFEGTDSKFTETWTKK